MTLRSLQLLRFVAAIIVLLFHLNLFGSGYKGVDMFFVISGFVMYYTLFYKPRPNAFSFAVNRFSKIFFLYWVALLMLYIIRPFTLDSSLLYTFLLVPGHRSLLGISWSLSYELYFYFAMGIVVYLLPKKIQVILFFILFFASTCITFLNLTSFTVQGSALNFFIGPNAWEFLLGIGCAFIALSYYKKITWSIALSAAWLCLALYMLIPITYAMPASYIFYGVLSFFTVLFFTIYEKNKSEINTVTKLFVILGDASYAIYLFGPLITLLITTKYTYSSGIIILTTISFSIAFNQLIEKRVLQWTRKIARGKSDNSKNN
jgi:exopolysaccharide production protein ExoZ